MVTQSTKLAQLQKLAQLKADRELRKFAAFSTNVSAARMRIAGCEAAIARSYASDAPLDLTQGRIASAEAGRATSDARVARRELERMMPKFEVARQLAVREFGRTEALRLLASRAKRLGR